MAQHVENLPATGVESRLREASTGPEAVRQDVGSFPAGALPPHVTETEAAYARRIATLTASKKVDLLRECRRLEVTGNHNTPKRVLLRRLVAHLHRSRADGRRSDVGGASTVLTALPVPPCGDRSTVGPRSRPSRSPSPSHGTKDVDMAAASTLAEALRPLPTDQPSSTGRQKRPAALNPNASEFQREPPLRRRRQSEVYEADIAARRRSNALASVRPARLDELLATHSDLRRLNVCIRGLPELSTTPEDASRAELENATEALLRELTGSDVVIRSVYRVGRISSTRPRPIIAELPDVASKVLVLRAKRVLYAPDCPASLQSIRIYHDLSPLQMDWKIRLRSAYDFFKAHDIRVIWRNGYRLLAFVDGQWTEYFPSACLIG